jgi:hypothetical protein
LTLLSASDTKLVAVLIPEQTLISGSATQHNGKQHTEVLDFRVVTDKITAIYSLLHQGYDNRFVRLEFFQWLDFLDERIGVSNSFRQIIDAIVPVLLSNDRLARRQICLSSRCT